MSNCRIERKRAHDREAQRQSRAKTKAYIAHLEKTVADLSESSGDGRANYLAQHASSQAQEIETLQATLTKIKSLVGDVVKSGPSRGLPPAIGDDANADGNKFGEGSSRALNWDSSSEDHDSTARNVRRRESTIPPPLRGLARNLNVLGVNLLCEAVEDTSYYGRVNSVLEKVEKSRDPLSNHVVDQDILIRAVVEGWDVSERVHRLDIGWRMIRAFDEGLWWRSGPIERFANFWSLRTILVNKIRPEGQEPRPTPAYLAPTARQATVVPHPLMADYFTWPEIRDFVIMMGTPQISGRSTIAFAESFRFQWPWELRDAYMKNAVTGMHEFSERFLKHFNDISCFRIVPETLSNIEPRIGWGSLGSGSESSARSDNSSAEYGVPPVVAGQASTIDASRAAGTPSLAVGGPGEQVPPPPPPPPPAVHAKDWPYSFDFHQDPRLLLEYAMDPLAMNENCYQQWPPL